MCYNYFQQELMKDGDDVSKVNDLKKENRKKIRECLYDGKIWTKNELSLQTGLSLASTTNLIQELRQSKEIDFIGEAKSTGGRKSKQYQLNKDYQHLLKVILKKNKKDYEFIFRIVDLYNTVLFQKNILSLKGTVFELKDHLLEIFKKDSKINLICLSLPGICHRGFVDLCDFEDFQNKNILNILNKEIPQKIIIENDVNCASIGFSHTYSSYQNSVLIYQPAVDYVGCGLIIEGKLYNGFSHFAGELRCLPFYDEQSQNKMLKDNPQELLEKQIATLCCVLNPEAIGICSDVLKEIKIHLSTIPLSHQPKLINITDLYEMIEEGLFQIGKKKIGENKNE